MGETMFRFIMMLLIMIASFCAGRMSAAEAPVPFVVENVAQAEITPQEILALMRNEDVKARFPEEHRKLIIFLATPQIKAQLVNPNRASSPLYQALVKLVI